MNLLEQLREWYERRPTPAAEGLAYTFTMEPKGGSARIDAEGDSAFGRVTVWASGLCDIEVIDADEGEQVLYRHVELTGEAELFRCLDEMVQACQSPRPSA